MCLIHDKYLSVQMHCFTAQLENKADMVGSSHVLPLATEIIFTVTIATGRKQNLC